MKTLILILSNVDGYQNMINTVKKTWASVDVEGVKKIFYFGNNSKNELIGNDLYLNMSESIDMIGLRTLEAFEYLINEDYDYLFRVNAGSYVRQDIMMSFLKDKPLQNFYCGIIGDYMGIRYCSGSGYFLSRDLVEKLVKTKYSMRLRYSNGMICIDDVAMGEMVRNLGVEINKSAKRLSLIDNKLEYQIGDSGVDYIDENEIYHYRIRSDYDRNLDIQKMMDLHKKFYN